MEEYSDKEGTTRVYPEKCPEHVEVIAPENSALHVIEAKYHNVDVTAQVRDMVSATGGSRLECNTDFNKRFGDPAPFVRKSFTVKFCFKQVAPAESSYGAAVVLTANSTAGEGSLDLNESIDGEVITRTYPELYPQPVSIRAPPGKYICIHEASYSVDVTAMVQAMVHKAGGRVWDCSSDFNVHFGDAAPGVCKCLVVKYSFEQYMTRTYTEQDERVEILAPTKKTLYIHNAMFHTQEVTRELREHLQMMGGNLLCDTVELCSLFGDPAPGKSKKFTVKFSYEESEVLFKF